MNILFVGQVVPHEICNNIKFSGAQKLNDTAGNNFYNHLLTGLANNGHHVDAMSRVTADISKEYGKEVSFDGVNYKFKHQKSNFLLNHISLFFSSFSLIKKWYKRNKKDGIVIVNCLRITQCLAAILAKKIYGIKIFSVVTDVPKHRVIDTNKNLVSKLADMDAKFNAWDESEMNAAEIKYYAEGLSSVYEDIKLVIPNIHSSLMTSVQTPIIPFVLSDRLWYAHLKGWKT